MSLYCYKILRANKTSGGFPCDPFYLGEYDLKNNHTSVTDIDHIFAYLNYGTIVAQVEIDKDSDLIYHSETLYTGGEQISWWEINKFNIISFMDINEISTINKLVSYGADITADNYRLFKYALYHNTNLWNYLSDKYSYLIRCNYSLFSE